MDGQLARQASIRTVLGIAAVKHWRAAKKGTTIPVALAEVVNELRFLRQVKGFLTPSIDDNTMTEKITKELSRWQPTVSTAGVRGTWAWNTTSSTMR